MSNYNKPDDDDAIYERASNLANISFERMLSHPQRDTRYTSLRTRFGIPMHQISRFVGRLAGKERAFTIANDDAMGTDNFTWLEIDTPHKPFTPEGKGLRTDIVNRLSKQVAPVLKLSGVEQADTKPTLLTTGLHINLTPIGVNRNPVASHLVDSAERLAVGSDSFTALSRIPINRGNDTGLHLPALLVPESYVGSVHDDIVAKEVHGPDPTFDLTIEQIEDFVQNAQEVNPLEQL